MKKLISLISVYVLGLIITIIVLFIIIVFMIVINTFSLYIYNPELIKFIEQIITKPL